MHVLLVAALAAATLFGRSFLAADAPAGAPTPLPTPTPTVIILPDPS